MRVCVCARACGYMSCVCAFGFAKCEDENEAGFVQYNKFEPMITRAIKEKRFQCSDDETLLRAFKVLDVENEGLLTEADLTTILTTEGFVEEKGGEEEGELCCTCLHLMCVP